MTLNLTKTSVVTFKKNFLPISMKFVTYGSMSDARRYAVRPEPRSRSRSLKGSRPSVPHGTNFHFGLLSCRRHKKVGDIVTDKHFFVGATYRVRFSYKKGQNVKVDRNLSTVFDFFDKLVSRTSSKAVYRVSISAEDLIFTNLWF